MRRKIKASLALLLALGLAAESVAAPSISELTPLTAGATYNTRPFITIKFSSAFDINNVRIQICSASCPSGLIYDYGVGAAPADACGQATNLAPLTFNPINATGTQIIKHRVQTAVLSAGNSYYLRACIWDTNAATSGWYGNNQFSINLTPTWTVDDPVTTSSLVKAAHFNEIRTAIANVRSVRNLTAASYPHGAPATGSTINAYHLSEMHTNLSNGAETSPFYKVMGTDPTTGQICNFGAITSGNPIRTCHINNLRSVFTNGTGFSP